MREASLTRKLAYILADTCMYAGFWGASMNALTNPNAEAHSVHPMYVLGPVGAACAGVAIYAIDAFISAVKPVSSSKPSGLESKVMR